jgi:FlaA1/EpsC-like NDP-sugar epimerase
MPSNFRRLLLTRSARLFDLGIVSLTFVAAFAISSGTFTWPSFAEVLLLRIKVVNLAVFAGYLALCSLIFSGCGFYLSHRLSHWGRQKREILIATTFITAIPLVLPFKMKFATTEFLFLFWLLLFSVLVFSRLVGYPLLYYLRARGRNLRNLVIVGEGPDAVALANRIQQDATLGYRVLQIIDTKKTGSEKVKAKA